MKQFLRILVHSALLAHVLGSLNIISSTGNLVPAAKIEKILESVKGSCHVVSAIGGRGCGKSSLLNGIFGCKLGVSQPLAPPALSKAGLEVVDGIVILDCEGIGNDLPTVPMQVASLASTISDVLFWNIWSSDIGRNVAINTQTLKVVFSQKLSGSPKKSLLLVAIHDCDTDFDLDLAKDTLMNDIQALWNDLEKGNNEDELADYFDLEFVALPHPTYKSGHFQDTCKQIREKLTPSNLLKPAYSKGITHTNFVTQLQKSWENAKKSDILSTKEELVAQYFCDEAYGNVIMGAEEEIRAWKAAVGKGKVISNFGDRVARLTGKSLDSYSLETKAYSGLSLREDKRREMKSIINTAAQDLLRRQLLALKIESLANLKSALTRKLAKNDEVSIEAKDACVREAAFAFECKANKLVHPDLDLDFSREKAELDAELEQIAADFSESPAAKLQMVKKLEKKVVKQPKGPRGVAYGLALTSMIRTDGYGNLQGFCNYKRGPHSVTIGYCNDRDSPEAIRDGGDVPYIRIQPKLNIEADL
mmetsp:Transcript_18464/g.24399  ORF Transcript_18464/g.24399 Transcript_18464/m.24399 type:complete len:533 (+) Transcript_18464:36-1634(+)|eukprot:CAMPEP_0117756656 /NCGR_PEP_ID=MMETSP0947-20121206/14220_1 /TAXON_ID=44440 /ORGANISM="Chattonella subsalsa, Strain CCMP2191" /LENGTH=532 /DNA_ID=CAMNT_0005576309 /DNA_START=117 /DNA_END=1715 /DNA_ORIENTATION=-